MKKKNPKPPVIASWIIKKYLPRCDEVYLLGDYKEIYLDILEKKGRFFAVLWYWLQVFSSFPYFFKHSILWRITMFKNYFKIAWRNILKNKGFSFINIFGLAFGVACCLLIFLYVQNELTYDRYHENSDRIYRISSTYKTSGESIRIAEASPALGPRLKDEYPEIEEYVRIVCLPKTLFNQKDKDITFYEENIVSADPGIFKVFTYEFLQGDPATCGVI
jgi:putative ABC transport system permease protein